MVGTQYINLKFLKHKGKRNVHLPKQITFLAERNNRFHLPD